ncbi:hypothetical protein [Kocuria marina]|uniref:hypothetical protein n=1 Tax=Kocuria marina TaxID=223184 RepID=UPI002F263982
MVTAKAPVLSATNREVESVVERDTSVAGGLPVLEEEFEMVEQILSTDDRWLASLECRGLPVEKVRVAPLSAGVFEYPDEKGRRMLRALAFLQKEEHKPAWATPSTGWWPTWTSSTTWWTRCWTSSWCPSRRRMATTRTRS